ncbi:MAG: hypothetical protein K6G01_11060 [Eubacterium sp.]|nr:hypothetical protein [Eubacterium sp.]
MEQKKLDDMVKNRFQGITQENVGNIISILGKLEPEVAKEIVAQMPETVRGILETEKTYVDLVKRGIESSEKSMEACYKGEDEILKACRQEIHREDTTFDEKQYYMERMEEAAKRIEEKDTEQKEYLQKSNQSFLLGLLALFGIITGIVIHNQKNK